MPGAGMDTKNDLNRIGLFSELGYISIGDPYVTPNSSKYGKSSTHLDFLVALVHLGSDWHFGSFPPLLLGYVPLVAWLSAFLGV